MKLHHCELSNPFLFTLVSSDDPVVLLPLNERNEEVALTLSCISLGSAKKNCH